MILVIGEALIDLIETSSGHYQAVVGGANANVALALACRGEPQLFMGRISSDSFGQQIRRHLQSHGVNLDYSVATDQPTTLAVASLDDFGVASYSFYTEGTADWGWAINELPEPADLTAKGVTAIQFGCLAMAIGPGNKVIESWLERVYATNSITLSHDLNIRPALGFDRQTELVRVESLNKICHIIKASDADIEWLYGLSDGSDLDQIGSIWSKNKVMIITRGEKGVSLFVNGLRVDVAGFNSDLVDTVGAGDTFMANFLAELDLIDALGNGPTEKLLSLSSAQLERACRVANAAASLVCEQVGCKPPTREQVLSKLQG